MKMQDVQMTDQIEEHEIAGHETLDLELKCEISQL